MFGTPELLSIPLAMITYGMDVSDVVDICCNLFDKIYDRLSVNGLRDDTNINVAEVINGLYDDQEIDEDTKNSILTFYKLS